MATFFPLPLGCIKRSSACVCVCVCAYGLWCSLTGTCTRYTNAVTHLYTAEDTQIRVTGRSTTWSTLMHWMHTTSPVCLPFYHCFLPLSHTHTRLWSTFLLVLTDVGAPFFILVTHFSLLRFFDQLSVLSFFTPLSLRLLSAPQNPHRSQLSARWHCRRLLSSRTSFLSANTQFLRA